MSNLLGLIAACLAAAMIFAVGCVAILRARRMATSFKVKVRVYLPALLAATFTSGVLAIDLIVARATQSSPHGYDTWFGMVMVAFSLGLLWDSLRRDRMTLVWISVNLLFLASVAVAMTTPSVPLVDALVLVGITMAVTAVGLPVHLVLRRRRLAAYGLPARPVRREPHYH